MYLKYIVEYWQQWSTDKALTICVWLWYTLLWFLDNDFNTIFYCSEYVIYIYIYHYGDVIMGEIASQITSLTIDYSTVYSDTDERIHQSSASLAMASNTEFWYISVRSRYQMSMHTRGQLDQTSPVHSNSIKLYFHGVTQTTDHCKVS